MTVFFFILYIIFASLETIQHIITLTQSSSLSLRLHQAKNIVLSDRSLDVSDNCSGGVVDHLDSDLGNTSSGSSSSENLDNFS